MYGMNKADLMILNAVFDVTIFFAVLRATSSAINCGQTYESLITNGSFVSPGWPSPFPANTTCVWIIKPPPNNYIELVITHFDLGGGYRCEDYLSITQGSSSIQYCTNTINTPWRYYSKKNRLKISFVSGSKVGLSKGIKANFLILPVLCPLIRMNGLSGSFSSPNFPHNYPVSLTCAWTIIVPDGYHVELNFTSFKLTKSNDCILDYVLIRNGQGDVDPVLGRFCSNGPSGSPIYSTGRFMKITFVSDLSVTSTGFDAQYKALMLPTEGLFTSSVLVTSPEMTVTATQLPYNPAVPTSTLAEQTSMNTILGLVTLLPSSTLSPTLQASPPTTVMSSELPSPTPKVIPDKMGGVYRIIRNFALIEHTMQGLVTPNDIACVLTCQRTAGCRAVTFHTRHQSSGLCTLHDTNMAETPGNFVTRESAVYLDLIK